MNTVEDRLHNLASHLDIELRSVATQPDGSISRHTALDNSDSIGELDASTPRERARLRTVTLSAAILVVIACVAAVVVLSRRVDDSSLSGAEATVTAPSPFDGNVALIVYMRPDAQVHEIDAVRATLTSAVNLVAKVDYLDTHASLAEAHRVFVDDPASLVLLTPDNIPSMFKVIAVPGATSEQIEQFAQTLQALPGVLRPYTPSQAPVPENTAIWDGGVGLIVYMRPGAPDAEVDAVRTALLDAADLVDTNKLEYLDTQAALAEARRVLADDPESLAHITADNVPTMFKVVPAAGVTPEQLDEFTQHLATLTGVLRADTPTPPITEQPTESEGTAVTATTFVEEAPTTDLP